MEKEIKLKENEVLIGGIITEIHPVKVKYMKKDFYKNYMTLKDNGIVKLLNCFDGLPYLLGLLQAVLDTEDIKEEMLDDLDSVTINSIMEITKRLNKIEDEIKNDQAMEMKE